MLAVYGRQLDMALSLLELGASLDDRDNYDRSLLHYAVREIVWEFETSEHSKRGPNWRGELMALLMNRSIDLELRESSGQTALQYAIRFNSCPVDAVKLLISAGANLDN